MFHFQIVAKAEQEAEDFMESVSAQAVSIEEWVYQIIATDELVTEVYGFGVTKYAEEGLRRIARKHGVVLAYVESEEKVEQEVEAAIQQLLKPMEHRE